MESLEGVHSVRLSSSPPFGPPPSSRGYELIRGRSGVAVYSNNATFFTRTSEERCIVGRLVDLDPQPNMEEGEGVGRADAQPQAEHHDNDHHGNVSRLRSSSLEIRERGSEILRQQLDTAQKELQMKGEECERLSQVREQLEAELEELTASLFEEAHKMVREANVKQAAAEKQLKEAQGKIDVLQAEVVALKALVLTSTPSSPNRQLHPQLRSPGLSSRGPHRRGGGGGGAHVRNKSASGVLLPGGGWGSTDPDPSSVSAQTPPTEDRESVSTLMSLFQCVFPAHSVRTSMVRTSRNRAGPLPLIVQMDSVLYAEFLSWRERPVLEPSSAFLGRVYREDIRPCLSFTRSELSQLVQSAVENNSLTIEPVGVASVPVVKASAVECGGPKKCALSGLSRLCLHRIKLGDKENYYYICPSSRARITSVCNFFTYIRYIQQGLVRHDAEQMFWEVMRLRREMTVTKLGFYITDQS